MFQPLWRELGAVPFSLWEESEPAFAACLLERLCFVLAPKRDPAVLAPRSLDQAVKAGPPRLKSGSLCGSTGRFCSFPSRGRGTTKGAREEPCSVVEAGALRAPQRTPENWECFPLEKNSAHSTGTGHELLPKFSIV